MLLFFGIWLSIIYYFDNKLEKELELEEWNESEQLYLHYLLENPTDSGLTMTRNRPQERPVLNV